MISEPVMLSPIWISKGTKRPVVFLYQCALAKLGYYKGRIDGIYGRRSASATKKFQKSIGLIKDGVIGPATSTELLSHAKDKGWEPDIVYSIMEAIAFYEVAGSKDAFGRASKISDGAGANYGIVQANRHGSCIKILAIGLNFHLGEKYKRSDRMKIDPAIARWFGSVDGVAAQVRYFNKVIWSKAESIFDDLAGEEKSIIFNDIWYERLMLFCVDTVVQNGTLYSPRRKPFLERNPGDTSEKILELYEGKRWDSLLGSWVKYDELKSFWNVCFNKMRGRKRETNEFIVKKLWKMAPDNLSRLIMLAQYRARCSWGKYWTAVERRRMLDATGQGYVNGRRLNLAKDFCIGIDNGITETN